MHPAAGENLIAGVICQKRAALLATMFFLVLSMRSHLLGTKQERKDDLTS